TGVTLSNNGNPVACPKSKLAPSESMVCTERVPAPVDGQTYLSSSAAQGTPARADDSVIAGVDPVSATDRASAITGTPPVGEPVPDQPTRRVPTRLPETGGPTIGLIWFGAGLLGAGLLVLRRSRHRRVRS
ncbi:MAG TPA: LPXTG cell wall anchor domain-containing protein, partial [Marmoricola sp.]|nr:LPXTG cell wall anchor domain-containing protein [Marmoricola sp.]